MKDFVYEKPFGMLIGKKHHCSLCGGLLVTEKVRRTVTDGDMDYNKYHERGIYPRRDVSVTTHRYKCSECKFRFTYDDQMVVSGIQKKLKRIKLTEEDIRDNYKEAALHRERMRRLGAIMSRIFFGILCAAIFWFMIGGTAAASNPWIRASLSLGLGAVLVGFSVLFSGRRKKGLSYDEIARLERLHTYSRSNKRLIERVERCHCFHCMQSFPSSEVASYTADEDTAICPNCGVDAVLPVVSTEGLDAKILSDMHDYWF